MKACPFCSCRLIKTRIRLSPYDGTVTWLWVHAIDEERDRCLAQQRALRGQPPVTRVGGAS